MADDLLERILREVRDRKQAARSAYEESQRLQAALDALGAPAAAQSSPAPRAQAPARRTSRGENRRRILEVLHERPGASAGEVAQVTGIARPTAASTLSKLAADGQAERVERPAGGVGFRIATAPSAGGTAGSTPEPAQDAAPEPEPEPEPAPDADPGEEPPADG